MISKVIQRKKLRDEAEQLYLRGEYTEAKELYEQALELTKDNTIIQNGIKSCILDCNLHLDTDDCIIDGSMELRDKLKGMS